MANIDYNKAKVISLPDEDGKDHFVDYQRNLGISARTSSNDEVKFAYFLKAVYSMQKLDFIDLPVRSKNPLRRTLDIEIRGVIYSHTFELIKPLHSTDIYELRLDLPNWTFRATFFPITRDGENFYCFVYPFEKFRNQQDPTNDFRDKTATIRFLSLHSNRYDQYFL